jgi:hypothetical protein
LVYPNKNTPVLAHDFAHIRNPEAFETVVGYALSISATIYGEKMTKNGINSNAEMLMKTFSFLLE